MNEVCHRFHFSVLCIAVPILHNKDKLHFGVGHIPIAIIEKIQVPGY